jgi:NADPH2:quinone reductase
MVYLAINADGVPPFDIGILDKTGSLFLNRPTKNASLPTRAHNGEAAREVFDTAQSGAVKFHINQRFPLRDAVEARRALECSKTIGAWVLLP